MPSTRMEDGFQDTEMEMRLQQGRGRLEHLPWRRRRRPRDNMVQEKAGGSWQPKRKVLAEKQH